MNEYMQGNVASPSHNFDNARNTVWVFFNNTEAEYSLIFVKIPDE
jgi:hypothetical protein